MNQVICDNAEKCPLLPCVHRVKHAETASCTTEECIQVGCYVRCIPYVSVLK